MRRLIWASLAGGVTLLVLAAFLGFVRFRVNPLPSGEQIRELEQLRHAERLRDIPSLNNLPAIEPMKMEEALVLAQIGRLVPTDPKQFNPWRSPNQASKFAPEVDFRVEYIAKNNDSHRGSEETPISVTVQQFPNEAWPLYFAKWSPNPGFVPEGNPNLVLTLVRKFNSKVVMDRQFPGKLWFFWPSGKNLVSVIYSSKANEEVLRCYLQKYRSSL
jgi:hypothetical protein